MTSAVGPPPGRSGVVGSRRSPMLAVSGGNQRYRWLSGGRQHEANARPAARRPLHLRRQLRSVIRRKVTSARGSTPTAHVWDGRSHPKVKS